MANVYALPREFQGRSVAAARTANGKGASGHADSGGLQPLSELRAVRLCRAKVFWMHGEESLESDYKPDDALREQVERAARPARSRRSVSAWEGYWKEGEMAGANNGAAANGCIVGASLAGLTARRPCGTDGFAGTLTLIGDEPYEPYDRPPLSKGVLLGKAAADHTALPRAAPSTPSGGSGCRLRAGHGRHAVRLADGGEVEFDRLLIATGIRARPWPHSAKTHSTGCSSCAPATTPPRCEAAGGRPPPGARDRGRVHRLGDRLRLPRAGDRGDLAERGAAPLVDALGGVVGEVAAQMQREHGVDLRPASW